MNKIDFFSYICYYGVQLCHICFFVFLVGIFLVNNDENILSVSALIQSHQILSTFLIRTSFRIFAMLEGREFFLVEN